MIPDFQQLKLPFLKVMADGKERRIQEVIDSLALTFKVSNEELQRRLPHGQKVFSCLVRRIRTEFHDVGLIEKSIRYRYWRITGRGLNVLIENPDSVDYTKLK
jgi:restriction system protein